MRRNHAAEMAALEQEFRRGRKRALIDAIYVCLCAHPEKPVPTWAKRELLNALRDIAMAKATSWDDVFGAPHHGRKIKRERKRREIQEPLRKRVLALRRRRPKPRAIFSIVAGEFKISQRAAKRWFERAQSNWTRNRTR